MRKVIILDFPSSYLFPPKGYGGIERRLYTTALSFKELNFEVYLVGPLRRKEVFKGFNFFEKRILDTKTAKDFINKYGKVDYLVGGHEYWHNKEYREIFELLSRKSFSFQHMPRPLYKGISYDRSKHYLFCYSDEMIERFKLQNPIKSICYTKGYKEEPIPGKNKGYLLWLGRLDKEKAPHYAVEAAIKLNIPIYLLGSPIFDKEYYKKNKKLFNHKLVHKLGLVSGPEKMKIIGNASCALYTLDKDYIESGVTTLGEFIVSGVPCAAISWKGNDCSVEAIGKNEFGKVYLCKEDNNEEDVINGLCDSIKYCLNLDRNKLLLKGQKKFNHIKILKNMLVFMK